MPRHFAWQAWHLVTSIFVSSGKRGTWRHLPSFCVAGVALGDIHLRFAWQAWQLATSPFVLRGRRGTWRHLPSFHVAGVALGDIHLLACFGMFLCMTLSLHVARVAARHLLDEGGIVLMTVTDTP